jgi:predicted cupin superfamily sugar epimerase
MGARPGPDPPPGGRALPGDLSGQRDRPPSAPGRAAGHGDCHLLPTQAGEISALHRIRSDELWHFHAGSSLQLIALTPDGTLREHRLGLDLEAGQAPQVTIPAGAWFGARLVDATGFGLVSCTVAPGFDFADFELGERASLKARYRQHADWIDALTRG